MGFNSGLKGLTTTKASVAGLCSTKQIPKYIVRITHCNFCL